MPQQLRIVADAGHAVVKGVVGAGIPAGVSTVVYGAVVVETGVAASKEVRRKDTGKAPQPAGPFSLHSIAQLPYRVALRAPIHQPPRRGILGSSAILTAFSKMSPRRFDGKHGERSRPWWVGIMSGGRHAEAEMWPTPRRTSRRCSTTTP
jgi:hypothetical protein